MKVFELHFNPGKSKKQNTVFDTFCFVPETRAETGLGSLYLLGEIKNILPKGKELLADLAEVIKNGYYEALPAVSTEERLKQALQKANEFLAREIRQENTGWLGNLNFATISLAPDLSINLSKVGNIKILVFTQGEVFSVGEDINVSWSAAKTFPNVVEGELTEGDKILVATKEVFKSFNEQGILENLAEIKKPKELKKFLKEKKKILRGLFGACLLVFVKKQRRKIYLNSPKISVSKISQKIAPHSPFLQTKLTKALFSILILAILLLLGFLLF